MVVLWLCNVALPEIARKEKLLTHHFGGWLVSVAEDLSKEHNINLHICFPCAKDCSGILNSISYFAFNPKNDNTLLFAKKLIEIKPDVVHIWGTEDRHSYQMKEACKKCDILDKMIVSIQGLVSIYSLHYYSGLPNDIIRSWSFHDFLKRSNIAYSQKIFENKGKYEKSVLKETAYVIGRTDWDLACSKLINCGVNYYHCNETLRPSFYDSSWEPSNCERHSIFVSQCSYPIKGFHHMLSAMRLILDLFPDAHLYTTGKDLLHLSFIEKLKISSYQKYIIKLIKKNGLEKHITFLGSLNEIQMKERYLKSNVFISCSSIENSPNSVGEAMLLGVPTISSDVGGVKNLLLHEKEGFLYPWDEPYMIPFYVQKIFNNDDLAISISSSARNHALDTHNRKKNFDNLLKIYKEITSNREKAK